MVDENKNSGTDNPEQIEFTKEFLKGAISDVLAGRMDELLGEQKNIFKHEMEEQLETIKANQTEQTNKLNALALAEEKSEDAKEKGLVGIKANMPTPYGDLGSQLKDVWSAAQGSQVKNLQEIHKVAQGLGESIPSDGGFLVQTDQSDELLRNVTETGTLMARTRVIPISAGSDSIKINAIDETSRVDGSRWGGVRSFWADEGNSPTASKPKFRKIELGLKKLIAIAYATDELLQDTAALGSILNTGFAEEMGFKIDDAIINGDGAGKPLGILNAGATVSQAKESGQSANSVVAENVFNMWSRMWGRSRANSVWLINQDVEPQLFGLKIVVGTGGIPVYLPAGGLSSSPFGQLFGRPVIPQEQCPTLGTVGDIILADLSQYVMINKGGMNSASSLHVRFVNDEMAFRFTFRVDGQPAWNAPLTPAKGSNTLSPFITLATRA